MLEKIFAIGDIHGCYNEMQAMIKKLEKEADLVCERDQVIFLGDYIDRGPESKKVVEQLIKWHKQYPHWHFLYGNHEDIFRDWLETNGKKYGQYNWFGNGGKTTYRNYGGHFGLVNEKNEFEAPKKAHFPKRHLDFLFKKTEYIYETEKYIFVHGGLVPETNSVEENKMYPDTLIWAREGFITSNYDWFGKKVIFGHTADYDGRYYNPKNPWGMKQKFMPIVKKNKIGIDCAVCPPANKRLCAIRLPDETFYFVESTGWVDSLVTKFLSTSEKNRIDKNLI